MGARGLGPEVEGSSPLAEPLEQRLDFAAAAALLVPLDPPVPEWRLDGRFHPRCQSRLGYLNPRGVLPLRSGYLDPRRRLGPRLEEPTGCWSRYCALRAQLICVVQFIIRHVARSMDHGNARGHFLGGVVVEVGRDDRRIQHRDGVVLRHGLSWKVYWFGQNQCGLPRHCA